jgi:hypothetical protein
MTSLDCILLGSREIWQRKSSHLLTQEWGLALLFGVSFPNLYGLHSDLNKFEVR